MLERIVGDRRIITEFKYSSFPKEETISSTLVYLRNKKKESLVYVHPETHKSIYEAVRSHGKIVDDVIKNPSNYAKSLPSQNRTKSLEEKT